MSTIFLVSQVVHCQLLLYAGFLVTSYYYKTAAEQLNENNEHLQHMNNSKSNFLSTIAHEIRTPLNAIIGSAELILKSAQQVELGKIIITSSTALLDSMNDMLQFIGLEQNPSETKHVQSLDFNVRTLVNDVLDISAIRAINNEHLTISNTWNMGNGSSMIHANYSHIKTILLNLVSNAIKFTPNGTVLIHVDVCEDHTIFKIRDTGIGMTDDFKQRIFTPFTQQDATIKQRFGGTGLGLSICKSLADSMQASLTFSSVINVGTTFTLAVPCKQLSLCQVHQALFSLLVDSLPHDESSKIGAQHVLVVDDNPINVKIMCKMIESCHVTCRGVVSAKEALDLLNTEQFDIMLDLQMPEMNGIECAIQIHQKFTSCKCPTILLVTGTELSMISEYDRQFVDGVFQKPIRMQALRELLSNSMEHHLSK